MVGALRITTNIRLASAVAGTADRSGMSACAATVGDRVRSRTILHYTRSSNFSGGFVPVLQQTNARYRTAAAMFTRGPIDNGIVRTSPKSRISFYRRPYSTLKGIYGLIYNNNNQTDYVSGCRIIGGIRVLENNYSILYKTNNYQRNRTSVL